MAKLREGRDYIGKGKCRLCVFDMFSKPAGEDVVCGDCFKGGGVGRKTDGNESDVDIKREFLGAIVEKAKTSVGVFYKRFDYSEKVTGDDHRVKIVDAEDASEKCEKVVPAIGVGWGGGCARIDKVVVEDSNEIVVAGEARVQSPVKNY